MKRLFSAAAIAAMFAGTAHGQAGTADPRFAKSDSEPKHGRQPGLFAGVGIGSYAYDSPDLGAYAAGGIEVRGGYNFNKYVSVSASALLPTSYFQDDSYNFTTATVGKVKSNLGVFVEPRLPLGDVVGLYARIGYVASKLEDVPERRSGGSYALVDHDQSGLALGAGIDFDIGRRLTLSFDVTSYNTDLKAAGAGLTLKGRF